MTFHLLPTPTDFFFLFVWELGRCGHEAVTVPYPISWATKLILLLMFGAQKDKERVTVRNALGRYLSPFYSKIKKERERSARHS